MDRIPVLFDTDIGTNVDDALALAYLLRQPACRLLGVTTVSGPVDRRAACAAAVCSAAGRADVPIHCGASSPLLFGPGQSDVPHFHALPAGPPVQFNARADAVEFLRDTIRQSPDPVMLLSTGPLTNIALLFALDPEIPRLLRGWVSMAGRFDDARDASAETNCRIDPVAAAMAFSHWKAAAGPSVSVGLDVTTRCVIASAELFARLTAPPLDVVRQMAGGWLAERDTVAFHDPLAAVVIFNPGLCEYADGDVAVDANPESRGAGVTSFTRRAGGPHRVARSVDAGAVFREFFSVFQ
jgi:purine nucleosidase